MLIQFGDGKERTLLKS